MIHTTIADRLLNLMASHPKVAAFFAAFLASWVLYGVLGKRLLGADNDFWPVLRSTLLPYLDSLAAGFPGFYAESHSPPADFVGIVSRDLDQLERDLEDLGYLRNPMAAYKTSPKGWQSDGSWARRYGTIQKAGDWLRKSDPSGGLLLRLLRGQPIRSLLGRFCQAAGDILATRQVHITLYEDPDVDDAVWVYAHDEPNSLNPITAWAHYRGMSQKSSERATTVRNELESADLALSVPENAHPSASSSS